MGLMGKSLQMNFVSGNKDAIQIGKYDDMLMIGINRNWGSSPEVPCVCVCPFLYHTDTHITAIISLKI